MLSLKLVVERGKKKSEINKNESEFEARLIRTLLDMGKMFKSLNDN